MWLTVVRQFADIYITAEVKYVPKEIPKILADAFPRASSTKYR